MDLREYYNLPEGTNVNLSFIPSFFDTVDTPYPCPPDMENAFRYYGGSSIPQLDVSNVTVMSHMFDNSKITTFDGSNWDTSKVVTMGHMFNNSKITTFDGSNWDVSKVYNMEYMFYSCEYLTSLKGIENWNTSEVYTMDNMFDRCGYLTSLEGIENWDTSNVTSMNQMFNSCTSLQKIGSLRADKVSFSSYSGIFGYSTMSNLTDFGGLINLKSYLTNYGFDKCPNLTYESCINILNGLHDFTGNGETPTSSQGKLKVHSNFLTLVGDEISIGTSRGWTITA